MRFYLNNLSQIILLAINSSTKLYIIPSNYQKKPFPLAVCIFLVNSHSEWPVYSVVLFLRKKKKIDLSTVHILFPIYVNTGI